MIGPVALVLSSSQNEDAREFTKDVFTTVIGGLLSAAGAGCHSDSVSPYASDPENPGQPPTLFSPAEDLISNEYKGRVFKESNDPNYYDDLYKEGIENYANTRLTPCLRDLNQRQLDFWCCVKGGQLFRSENHASCNQWRLYNPDDIEEVCAGRILHVAEFLDWSDFKMGGTKLDDDYDQIHLYRGAMMLLPDPSGVPGIDWWNYNLRIAGADFALPCELVRRDAARSREFRMKFIPLALEELQTNPAKRRHITDIATSRRAILDQLIALEENPFDRERLLIAPVWNYFYNASRENDWATLVILLASSIEGLKQYYKEFVHRPGLSAAEFFASGMWRSLGPHPEMIERTLESMKALLAELPYRCMRDEYCQSIEAHEFVTEIIGETEQFGLL